MNVLKCKITNGAFSGEKSYEISHGGFKSISHPSHLIAADFSRFLTKNDPPSGEVMDGYVECRILHHYQDDKILRVNVPSGLEGETIEVPIEAVLRGVQVPDRIDNNG